MYNLFRQIPANDSLGESGPRGPPTQLVAILALYPGLKYLNVTHPPSEGSRLSGSARISIIEGV